MAEYRSLSVHNAQVASSLSLRAVSYAPLSIKILLLRLNPVAENR